MTFLAHRPRQLNPAETSAFMADMTRLPPEHGADVAATWRERCVEICRDQTSPAAAGGEILLGTLYSAGIGAWDGANEAKRQKMVREWREVTAKNLNVNVALHPDPFRVVKDADGRIVWKGEKDPRDHWGVNKTFYPTAAIALVAGFGAGGHHYNRYVRAPAVGGAAYLAGTALRDAVYRRENEKNLQAEYKAVQSAGNGGNGGAEGNPSWQRFTHRR